MGGAIVPRHTLFHQPRDGVNYNIHLDIIKFSPDGTKLMTGDSYDINIWNVATGELHRRITFPNYPRNHFCSVAQFLTIDDELYIVVGINRNLEMWNVDTGNRVWSTVIEEPHLELDEDEEDQSFLALAVSPDQSLIAFAFASEVHDDFYGRVNEMKLCLYNQAGEHIHDRPLRDVIQKMVFTNDGSKIIAAHGKLVMYNAHDLGVFKTIAERDPQLRFHSVAIAKDGRICAGARNGHIMVWSPDGNEILMNAEKQHIDRHANPYAAHFAKDICFSPDDMHILFYYTKYLDGDDVFETGDHGYLCICDSRSGNSLHDIYIKTAFIKAIDCSKDYIIAAGSCNRIQITQNTSLEERRRRRRERKTMMLSLRRANRRRRDRQGNQLPSVAGRKVYDASGVLKNVHDFL